MAWTSWTPHESTLSMHSQPQQPLPDSFAQLAYKAYERSWEPSQALGEHSIHSHPASACAACAGCTEIGEDGELALYNPRSGMRKQFKYDRVFGAGSSQEEVYEDTKALIRSVLDGAANLASCKDSQPLSVPPVPCDWRLAGRMTAALQSLCICTCHTAVMTGGHAMCRGQLRRWLSTDRHGCCVAGYNVCIFAYGQTGSGKTHTMAGSDVEDYAGRGINYRALDDLFAINEERQGEVRLTPLISLT